MTYFYFDTSALAKRYIKEVGSTWVREVCAFASGNVIFVSEITTLEITSAITRRSRGGTLTIANAEASLARLDADLLNEYVTLDLASRLFGEACSLVKTHELRAYDAIHFAAAVSLNNSQKEVGLPAITFVSADIELVEAATSEGLLVENPNNYP